MSDRAAINRRNLLKVLGLSAGVAISPSCQRALESGADLVNFDAYAYFDRFILYGPQIRDFLAAGRLLAWGIV